MSILILATISTTQENK
ncbi:hypothetical protein [Escherichia coli]|nr:hypothetical protein [Escherichia coli]